MWMNFVNSMPEKWFIGEHDEGEYGSDKAVDYEEGD